MLHAYGSLLVRFQCDCSSLWEKAQEQLSIRSQRTRREVGSGATRIWQRCGCAVHCVRDSMSSLGPRVLKDVDAQPLWAQPHDARQMQTQMNAAARAFVELRNDDELAVVGEESLDEKMARERREAEAAGRCVRPSPAGAIAPRHRRQASSPCGCNAREIVGHCVCVCGNARSRIDPRARAVAGRCWPSRPHAFIFLSFVFQVHHPQRLGRRRACGIAVGVCVSAVRGGGR